MRVRGGGPHRPLWHVPRGRNVCPLEEARPRHRDEGDLGALAQRLKLLLPLRYCQRSSFTLQCVPRPPPHLLPLVSHDPALFIVCAPVEEHRVIVHSDLLLLLEALALCCLSSEHLRRGKAGGTPLPVFLDPREVEKRPELLKHDAPQTPPHQPQLGHPDHSDELLEVNGAVPVRVNLRYHAVQVPRRHLHAHRPERVLDLLELEGAIAINVYEAEHLGDELPLLGAHAPHELVDGLCRVL
mmetsp:Transcript_33027/g.84659  ORF Transcript_33027/g.84659 Transcript_33027/m.84659 type:complete len:241 (+) Transcript_33027:905-1627(+)